MAATIVLSGVETYSSNMDSYSNSLSLYGINGPGGVGNYISCLNSKLEALQISIATYTSHINKQKDELENIEDTIARNFDNRLSGSAVATDLLSNNFGVTVGGVFYGFDESNPNNSRLIGVIRKIINNINNGNDDIYFGLTQNEIDIINKDEYSSLRISLEGTNIDNLSLENAYLKKNSHSLEDLLEEIKILNNNEYVESAARNELKNKGYNSEQIELIIQFKNKHALEGWHMSDKEWNDEFSDVYNAMLYPDDKKSSSSSGDNKMPSGTNNNGDGSSSGAPGVTTLEEQNKIDFRNVDLTDHNFHLAPNELNLKNSNNKVYIQLDSKATLDEISKAYGGIPYKYIKRYYPETGQTDVISDPQSVFENAYYVIDVSDIQ